MGNNAELYATRQREILREYKSRCRHARYSTHPRSSRTAAKSTIFPCFACAIFQREMPSMEMGNFVEQPKSPFSGPPLDCSWRVVEQGHKTTALIARDHCARICRGPLEPSHHFVVDHSTMKPKSPTQLP